MNDDNENQVHDTTPPRDERERPLGYWLRAVEHQLDHEFAVAFEQEGITRREWMILNVLDGTVDAPHLVERIQRGKKLRSLADRGWVEQADGAWQLTDAGREAKGHLGATVDSIRSRVAGAVDPEAFATTLASLEAIARELGWSEDERMPFGPRGGRAHHRGGRFGRGFGPRGFDREGFGPGGFAREGFGPGFGPRRFGHPHHGGECGHDRFGDHDPHRGGPRHHGHRHGHGHGHGDGRSQNAYERGFDAGYSRGREERSA
jgi:hypothetical protein